MASERFHVAFDRLLRAWRRHQDASRRVEDLPELSAARIELDDARAEVADARPVQPAVRSRRRVSDEERAAYWRWRARTTTGGLG